MSESDRYKNRGTLWLITAIVVVLAVVICAVVIWLTNRDADPTLNSNVPTSSSSEPEEPSSSPEPEEPSSSEPEESSSSEAPSSSEPVVSSTPATRPVIPPAPTRITIDEGGDYTDPATYEQIVISAGGVFLQNKTVTGDLFIMDSVGDGTVTLENIIVEGTLYIYGGGDDGVTLRDVAAERVHLQKDSGTLGVTATGNTYLDNTIVKCHAVLTESSLGDGAYGFQRVVVNESQKIWYEIALKSVKLDELAVNSSANIALNKSTRLDTAYANASTHFSGTGSIGELVVRSDNVSYENAPKRITVKGDYQDPEQGGYPIGTVPNETGETSGGSKDDDSSSSWVKLSAPGNPRIEYDGDSDSFYAVFDPVRYSGGYTVIAKVDGKETTYQLGGDTTSVVILADASGHVGESLSFRVMAKGSSADQTLNSNYISAESVTVRQLASPTPVATLNTAKSEIVIDWGTVSGARSYNLVVMDNTAEPPVTSELYTGTKTTYTYPIDPGIPGEKSYTFGVTALSADSTGYLNGTVMYARPVTTTVLTAPTQVRMEQNADGSITARWENGAGYAGISLTKIVNGQSSTPITLGLVDHYNLATAAEVAASESISFRVSAIAQAGSIGSAAVTAESTQVTPVTSVPQSGLSIAYHNDPGKTPGYYAVWTDAVNTACAQVDRFTVTPIIDGAAAETSTLVEKGDKECLLLAKSDFAAGRQVSFRIQPVAKEVGQVLPEATVCAATEQVMALAAPTGLTTTLQDDGSVELSFTPGAGNPDGTLYQITPVWDGVPGTPFEKSAQTTARVDLFDDSKATLTFQVQAFADSTTPLVDTQPTDCSTDMAVVRLAQPVAPELSVGTDGKLTLSFTGGLNALPGVTQYEILPIWDGVEGTPLALTTELSTVLDFAADKNTFTYKVRAVSDPEHRLVASVYTAAGQTADRGFAIEKDDQGRYKLRLPTGLYGSGLRIQVSDGTAVLYDQQRDVTQGIEFPLTDSSDGSLDLSGKTVLVTVTSGTQQAPVTTLSLPIVLAADEQPDPAEGGQQTPAPEGEAPAGEDDTSLQS